MTEQNKCPVHLVVSSLGKPCPMCVQARQIFEEIEKLHITKGVFYKVIDDADAAYCCYPMPDELKALKGKFGVAD